MAHHEGEATLIEHVMEVVAEQGFEGMAAAMRTLLNEAMKIERNVFLRAAPGERTDERAGYLPRPQVARDLRSVCNSTE